jgi:pimeloyl-ACP methyl ester carboxylesterase
VKYAAVAAPTLILHGELKVISTDRITALTHATLVKAPGGSHFPCVERNDLVLPPIKRFLQARLP